MKISNQNYIQPTFKGLNKVEWKEVSCYGKNIKFFENIPIKNEILGDLSVGIREYIDGSIRQIIEIKNAFNKVLGKEIISIENPQKPMYGFYIEVLPEYRKKDFRFGELLRITSVMEMLENKASQIEIKSKDSAIYFHAKYKFTPFEKNTDDSIRILKTIINDSTEPFSDLKNKAKVTLETLENNLHNPPVRQQLHIEINNLADEYIKRALKTPQPNYHSFDTAMYMKLTRENIEKNKDFYNNLWAKYGIDYKI